MEALPIFLDRLLNPVAAILISVTAILIFGEVLPQAICKKIGLQIGAQLAWLVRLLMFITWPISYPFGKLLDWLFGEEKALFRRAQLREFVTLHAEADGEGEESMLTSDEVQVIHGALDMAHKTADAAMTPLDKVFSISADAPLNRALLGQIIDAGHSRVPVYEGGDFRNIIGLILVKELLVHDFSQSTMLVRDCKIRDVDFIWSNTPLYAVMELFRVKRRHLAVLMAPFSIHSNINTTNSNTTPATDIIGRQSGGNSRGGNNSSLSGSTPPGNSPHVFKDFAKERRDTGGGGNGGGGGTLGGGSLGRTATLMTSGELGNSNDVVGIITIEDVIEELLMVEIQDETDVYLDNSFLERVTPTPGDGALPADLQPYLAKRRRRTLMALARQLSGGGGSAMTAAAAAAAVTRQARRETAGARSPPTNRIINNEDDERLLDV